MDQELQSRLAALEQEFAAARAKWEEERAALLAEIRKLSGEVARLESENNRLREQLADAQREKARQAAPFRRHPRRKLGEKRKRPGRKPGHPGANRQIPERIDSQVEVPLCGCPGCGGAVDKVRAVEQYITEIPEVRPVTTKVTTYVGQCAKCGEIRSTHPLQTSTAEGAAKVQLGPRALAWGAELNKRLGLSMRKTCSLFERLLGLTLTPGGLSQALDRVAQRCRGEYYRILDQVRQSPAVYADETSWWVGEAGWWLWTFTTPEATFYRVEQSRGNGIVRKTLGRDFRGVLVTDCGAMYDQIQCRKHKCIAHHLQAIERAREMQDSRFHLYLDEWVEFFRRVIALWKEWGQLPPPEFQSRRADLERQCDEMLTRELRWAGDKAVQKRLKRKRDHLLTCLHDPHVEPTNNRAERSLRPAVIARKLSCGNRTILGKQTWEVIQTLAFTCHQKAESLIDYLAPKLQLAAA
jgi:transposase